MLNGNIIDQSCSLCSIASQRSLYCIRVAPYLIEFTTVLGFENGDDFISTINLIFPLSHFLKILKENIIWALIVLISWIRGRIKGWVGGVTPPPFFTEEERGTVCRNIASSEFGRELDWFSFLFSRRGGVISFCENGRAFRPPPPSYSDNSVKVISFSPVFIRWGVYHGQYCISISCPLPSKIPTDLNAFYNSIYSSIFVFHHLKKIYFYIVLKW